MAIPANLLDGISRLDPLPVTLQRLLKALEDESVGASQIGEIVQFDHAVVASLLRAANSAAFGGWIRTESVRDAVSRLGKTRVIDMILGDHLRKLQVNAPLYDLSEDDLWLHSTAASLAVRAITRECPKAGLTESASIAGLVHDVGKLIMVRYMKADFSAILAVRDHHDITFVEAERELIGCDHAEVGGEVARHWGFPADIQEAIARHHETEAQLHRLLPGLRSDALWSQGHRPDLRRENGVAGQRGAWAGGWMTAANIAAVRTTRGPGMTSSPPNSTWTRRARTAGTPGSPAQTCRSRAISPSVPVPE